MPKFRIIASMLATIGAYSLAIAQFTGPAPVTWRWQQPSTIVADGSPVVKGNTVFVASGQRLYALDRSSGNQIWRFPIGEPLAAFFKGTPVYSKGTIYAVADNKFLYAIDAQTGLQKWTYRSDENFVGSPKVSGNVILFENSDGNIMGINAKDGTPFYQNPLVIDNGIMGQMEVSKDDIICFNGNNSLVAINVA